MKKKPQLPRCCSSRQPIQRLTI